ncbi:glycoside hydrolase family 5 protein [Bradyrhizobium sp.]|uniref:glycoside hydrolase family 5 protein n=1 Tax=Bradyrhizobium sp. TaxID=376 RepID=UPI001EC32B78|nr:glycoside hydrolase family 5 protein [Bradyrhizobium sp.]MBV9985232.1 glycoside hydrolase family 5 protein [Bradyrhizobium sp.]
MLHWFSSYLLMSATALVTGGLAEWGWPNPARTEQHQPPTWSTFAQNSSKQPTASQGEPPAARWALLRSVPSIGTGNAVTFEIHETNHALTSPTSLRLAMDGSSTASDVDFVEGLNEAVAAALGPDVSYAPDTGMLTFSPRAVFPFRFTMTASSFNSEKDYVLVIKDNEIGQIDVARAGIRLGSLARPSAPPLLGLNEASGDFGIGQYKYAYPGKNRVDWAAALGFGIIRLPFLFQNIQPASGANLDEAAMQQLDPVLAECGRRTLVCLLDMHNYGSYYLDDSAAAQALPGTPGVSNARLAELWAQIARRYRDNPYVWFGLMNEPHQQTALEWVKTSNAIAAAIRATGATNKIVFSGTAWDGAWTWTTSGNATEMLKAYDPAGNFAFEAHQYLDGDGSGTSPICVAGAGAARIAPFTEWLKTYRLQGILGEVGWAANPQCQAEGAALLEAWQAAAAVSDTGGYIGLTYWADGPLWPDSYMYLAEPRPFPGGPEPPQLATLKRFLPQRPN